MDDSSGVINVRLAEMVVGNLNLRYVDRKTGEVREEGATRPEVVLRQLSTRPGQAGALGYPIIAPLTQEKGCTLRAHPKRTL